MTRRYYFRPFKPDTIVATLHHLRCIIVRDDQPGLDHVDALLRQLGADPDTLPMPRKVDKHFKRGELRRLVLSILRDGPLTGAELARRVQGNGLAYDLAYKRVYQCLAHMKKAGLVRCEGGVWLAQ